MDAQNPPPPTISGLGSGPNIQGPPLPVGAYAKFTVLLSAQGWTVNPATIQWSGNGTDYQSYFFDPATSKVSQDPYLQAVKLVKGVATTNDLYSFIVGAKQQQYTITVNCSYKDPNGGADIPAPPSTVTFSSVRPTVATIQGNGGFQSFYTITAPPPTGAFIAYADNNNPWKNGIGNGNVIEAWTQTAQFGGTFMFLQLIDTYRGWTNSANASFHQSNVGGGQNLDDGAGFLTVGRQLDLPYPPNGGPNSWPLGPNSNPTMAAWHDPPSMDVPLNALYMKVSETYYTYLMYQPAGGVWVALAELTWSLNQTANNAPNWPGNSATTDNGGTVSTPTGDAAFPGWTYDTSSLTWLPNL